MRQELLWAEGTIWYSTMEALDCGRQPSSLKARLDTSFGDVRYGIECSWVPRKMSERGDRGLADY